MSTDDSPLIITSEQEQADRLATMTEAAFALALALSAMPDGEVLEDESTQGVLAVLLNLTSVDDYKQVRDQLLKHGWVIQVGRSEGIAFRLTSQGRKGVEELKRSIEGERRKALAGKPDASAPGMGTDEGTDEAETLTEPA